MAVNPTAPPAEQATDPNSQYVSASAFDLLLIEIVPMAYRLAAELEAREAEFLPPDQTATTTKNKRISGGASATGTAGTAGGTAGGGTTGGTATGTGLEGGPVGEAEDEERREAVYQRLDKLGYRVGLGIVEKYVAFCSLQLHTLQTYKVLTPITDSPSPPLAPNPLSTP